MGKCKSCGCWLAPEWLLRLVEYAALVIVVTVACLAAGCSHRTLHIAPDGAVNATSTTLLYCPEASLIRAGDVQMVGETAGVGATVQALGRDAVEVMR